MKRKRILGMFSTLSRATVIGLAAVVSGALVVACSNDNPAALTSLNNDAPLQKSSGTTEAGAPPAEGIVVEGVSVPGVALGSTRAEVEEAWGEELRCEGTGASSCYWDVPGGGEARVSFRDPHGGGASNSPDDVAVGVYWTEPVSGWTTTAGVNTTLADEDPEALVAAYPNAQVTYYTWGGVFSVIDYELGISFTRQWIIYSSGEVFARAGIFYPTEPPPLPEPLTHVSAIHLSAQKIKGNTFKVSAHVTVRNETYRLLEGATVFARWTFPDGSTQAEESTTTSSGSAYFVINGARGTYTLTVEDVVAEGREFDPDKSVLSESIVAKK